MFILSTYYARYVFLAFFMVITLTGCTNTSVFNSSTNQINKQVSEWDFDHELQYKKTRLSANTYQLDVITNNNVSFERLSAFLLRQSYRICGQYGYKIEVLKGVESFDHKKASPNLILPNLAVNLECPIAQ